MEEPMLVVPWQEGGDQEHTEVAGMMKCPA